MKLRIWLWTGVAALVMGTPALAQQSVEERVSGMEKRIQYLEQRVADQDKVIVEKDEQIAELGGATEWARKVSIGGALEIEGVHENPAGEDGTTSVGVGTAEFAIGVEVNDWASAEVVIEADFDDEDRIVLGDATVTLAPPDGPVSLTAGRLTLPFGTYETALGHHHDSLTLELGETGGGPAAAVVELSAGALSGSLFVGEAENERFENFGAAVSYSIETETPWEATLDVNASYISQILTDAQDAGGFSELPGLAASAKVGVGGISLIGEYLRAAEEQNGSQPSAWMFEVGYEFDLLGYGAGAALSYSRTLEAADTELAEARLLAGVSVELMEGVGVSLEWQQDEAYGSDDTDTTVAGVLALEF